MSASAPKRLVVSSLIARDLKVGDIIIKTETQQGRTFPFTVYTVTRDLDSEVAALLGGTLIEGATV